MEIEHQTMLALIALLAVFSSTAQAEDRVLEEQKQGNISYVTGGIGEAETKALRATKPHYGLRVMNADKEGHFSGETHIKVSDTKGLLLLDTATGPIFYANMPEGNYLLESFNGQQTKQQRITMKRGTPVDVRFSWSKE